MLTKLPATASLKLELLYQSLHLLHKVSCVSCAGLLAFSEYFMCSFISSLPSVWNVVIALVSSSVY